MPAETARYSSRARMRPRLIAALVGVAVLGAVAWTAMTIGNPIPPRTVTMATGPEGSANEQFGERYRQILQRAGIELRPLRSAGGVENLALLRDPHSGVSVAILEGGLTSRDESPDLVSLGAISLEPLWIFIRGASEQGTAAQKVVGKRISIEPEGSATRVLARRFLALNGVDERNVELLGLTAEESAEALIHGEIDFAMMLTSWRSPAVQKLLVTDGIVLENHWRADAYVALFPTLNKVVLPAGVADLGKNIPPADVQLIAIEASLVVHGDLHPALQYLLLEAAAEVHGGPEVFHRAGRFPAPEAFDLPLSHQAQEFYKSGRPFVYRYLPLWLAGMAERLLILLIPLFTIVFPLVHFLPTAYAFFIQRRIFSLYGELKFLESEMAEAGTGKVDDDIAAAMADLAKRAQRLRVPLGYAQRLFILKSHIALAQEEIDKRRMAFPSADKSGITTPASAT